MHRRHPHVLRAVLAMLLGAMVIACQRKDPLSAGNGAAAVTLARAEIFAAIEVRATRYRLEPAFIYALVAAESNFNPRARNGEACGLLQLKPGAWRTVSNAPFEPGVWDWRANLDAGVDYLAYSRAYLLRKKVFSSPLLLAAFHYGLDYVEERQFDLDRLPVPQNEIYRQLWAGNLAPVPLPSPQPGNKKPATGATGN